MESYIAVFLMRWSVCELPPTVQIIRAGPGGVCMLVSRAPLGIGALSMHAKTEASTVQGNDQQFHC